MEAMWVSMVQLPEGVTPFIHINQNDFSGQKHIKQKEEDIAICECKYDVMDPDSACGERCLNLLTSTECTPGYCPCLDYCKNQRFQKCEYAKTKFFKTEGCGWGLVADENIQAGQFIIEYCGEVISSEEAKQRSQTYEAQGLTDAYIILLDANSSIDATRMGSLARFINHSCEPNCETRKWTVLGETRVGIFAKQDISVGTELAYDYNFEWYGGANVRCLCGAANCSKFLGAKSYGFQEYNHLWEEGDDRYTVEEIPIYDSAEDDPSPNLPETTNFFKTESIGHEKSCDSMIMDGSVGSENQLESSTIGVEPLSSPMEGAAVNPGKAEMVEEIPGKADVVEETKPYSQDTPQAFSQKDEMMSHIQINSASPNFNIGPGPVPKKSSHRAPNRRSKHQGRKQFNAKNVAQLFAAKEAQEEVMKCEELRSQATSKLNAVYDEIRPAIEEHERDNQDSVSTDVGQKWIGAYCAQMKADFNFSFSIVENVICPPQKAAGDIKPEEADDEEKPPVN